MINLFDDKLCDDQTVLISTFDNLLFVFVMINKKMKSIFVAHATMYVVAHEVVLWRTKFCGACSLGAP